LANVPEDEDAFPQNEDGYSLYEMDVSMPITTDCHMPMKVGESSPAAIPASVYVLVVNPYSQHKEEAIRYLEYCAQNVYDETQYRIFADMTEPLVNTYQEQRIAELAAQIASLETQEQMAKSKSSCRSFAQARRKRRSTATRLMRRTLPRGSRLRGISSCRRKITSRRI